MNVKRVLLSAYSCEPNCGSEPGIGWNWTRQVSRRYETWLITRENNVEAIEKAAREEGLDRLHVVGFDLPPWARFWKRGPRGSMAYFYLWQLAMGRTARKLEKEIGFDVVHHLTFASSWIPSGLASLDRPFVWGPVGQHPRVPDRFIMRGDLRLRLSELGKAAARGTLSCLDPWVRRTRKRADRILSLGTEFSNRLSDDLLEKLEPVLACGTLPQELSANRFSRTGGFRVLFAGRLVDLKGIRLAIDAFAEFAVKHPDARLDLMGDGPRRSWIEARIRKLGMQEKIVLHGNLPHEAALGLMHTSDVFLFPSFEGAGMVVPEAMAAGNPVVCLDFGGPGEMVDDDRGLRVPVGKSVRQTVSNLRDALEQLATDEMDRRRMARNAADWAATTTCWDAKGEQLGTIYADAIEHYAAVRA